MNSTKLMIIAYVLFSVVAISAIFAVKSIFPSVHGLSELVAFLAGGFSMTGLVRWIVD